MPRAHETPSIRWRAAIAAGSIALAFSAGCGESSGSGLPEGAGFGGSGAPSPGGHSGSGGSAGGASGSSSQGAVGGRAGSGGGAGGAGSHSGGAAGYAGALPLGGSGGAATGGASGGGVAGAAGGPNEAPRVTLFDGNGLSKWSAREGGGNAPWLATAEYFSVAPSSGDLTTRDAFGDVHLHVEFWVPATPASNDEQDRGNSGIYLQGRYEVQVLDSYNHPLDGANDCGAIYELQDADVNASLPAETWQTYDITFHAPRWSGTQKTANARVSVVWNGQLVHADVEVPAPTRLGDAELPGDAPLRLQDHSHAVRYRNIWLRPL